MIFSLAVLGAAHAVQDQEANAQRPRSAIQRRPRAAEDIQYSAAEKVIPFQSQIMMQFQIHILLILELSQTFRTLTILHTPECRDFQLTETQVCRVTDLFLAA